MAGGASMSTARSACTAPGQSASQGSDAVRSDGRIPQVRPGIKEYPVCVDVFLPECFSASIAQRLGGAGADDERAIDLVVDVREVRPRSRAHPGCRAGRGPGDARLPLTIRPADLLDGEVDAMAPLDSNQAAELLRGIDARTSPANHFHSKGLSSNRIRR